MPNIQIKFITGRCVEKVIHMGLSTPRVSGSHGGSENVSPGIRADYYTEKVFATCFSGAPQCETLPTVRCLPRGTKTGAEPSWRNALR